jgi:hypothetical protein
LQEIALKLRSEGRTYNPRVFKRKQFSGEGGPAHKKVRVKVKSSQRNKQPYHVSVSSGGGFGKGGHGDPAASTIAQHRAVL